MATKKPAAKKTSAVKKTSSAAKSGSTAKKGSSIASKARMIYAEKHPEKHQATGKYKFFYILFACTTLFFAALSVELFVIASEVESKYETIESCTRAHTKCNVRLEDGNINVEGSEE
ncbi:MAG: hypothetical protein MJ154_00315 [Candidatus Saccharibacteria bacterium]|nr:hypothetical protein [Candidatus Saccharibacteria bacterium]